MCDVRKVCGWEALVIEISPESLTYLRIAVLATLNVDDPGAADAEEGGDEAESDEEADEVSGDAHSS